MGAAHGTSSDIAIFLPSRPPPLKTVPLAILSPALLKLLRLPPTTAAGSFDAQRFPGLNAESRLRRPSLSFHGAIAASPARSALQSVRPTLMPVRENRHVRRVQKLQLAHDP